MIEYVMEQQSRLGFAKSISAVWALAVLLLFLAHILGGVLFSGVAAIAGLISYLITPRVTPSVVLRFYRGVHVTSAQMPGIHSLLSGLSDRAGLPHPPELWLLPTMKPIAFATGDRKHSAVALSEGIINTLSPDELAGVVAHEVSHIAHNDNRMMWFSVVTVKMIYLLSAMGQLLVLAHLPSILSGSRTVSLGLLAVVVFSPLVAMLLQLGLLRTREFAADIGSAKILGSPEPLVMALRKLEGRSRGLLRPLGQLRKEQKGHTLFRTHPPVRERLKRLKALSASEERQMVFAHVSEGELVDLLFSGKRRFPWS